MKRAWLKWMLRGAAAFVVVAGGGFGAFALSACAATGATAEGSRLSRMQASPQWHDGAFANKLERIDGDLVEMTMQAFQGVDGAVPTKPIDIERRKRADFDTPPASGLRVTWLGHSTLIVEIDGRRVLVDPVWGEKASPVTWLGPTRFHEPPLPLDELPAIDAVVISHDHYDHLDYPTVVEMVGVDTLWIVPLGIGAHLEEWGMPAARIVELDWWEERKVGDLTVTCTPARHFSGRSVTFTDQNATLWAGWALVGPEHRVFYSGDTALHPEFTTIGERLGPFDLTMIETGAADALWSDVHLGPEQAVIAHQMVGGKVMLPVHWGTFNLGNHSWTEPVQRVLVAAEKVGVTVVAPRPGGSVEPADGPQVDPWWDPDIPWATVAERPAWSTSVQSLLVASPLYTGKTRQE